MVAHPDELRRIAARVGPLSGWDFSRMRTERDPTPWDYEEVVRRYLTPGSRVLDLGTGGGEVFARIAPAAGRALATDVAPTMLRAARTTLHPWSDRVSLALMANEALAVADASFDLVLDRHSSVVAEEVARALRPGGVFITQQVGRRNTQAIFDAFGWGSNAFWEERERRRGHTLQTTAYLVEVFPRLGCRVEARAEYDVPWFIKDVQSLVFFLTAPVWPEDFDPDRHAPGVARLLAERITPRGIETNEHRELLIVRKE
jgi:SAM-dependent methyltransferase